MLLWGEKRKEGKKGESKGERWIWEKRGRERVREK